ncbi:unnamed protein product [Ectocarpus sp. 4 AP-2014]
MRTRGGSLRGATAENLALDKHATARRSRRRSTRSFGDRRSENLVAEEVSIPTAGAAGDDKAGETDNTHCFSLPGHASGDVAAGDTKRASPSAVGNRHEKSCNVENQHVVERRRSARCLSMSAAVANQVSSVQRYPRSRSSAASSLAPTVLTNCDVNVATAQANTQTDETEKDRVEGSTPPPPPAVAAASEEPVKQYPASSAPGAYGPAPAPVDAEDNPPALAELTSAPALKVCPITTTAPPRRASIPYHRSEKHPAALRRRPFSLGSGVLDNRHLLIIPPFFAAPEINPAIGSDGSIGDASEAVPRGSLAELAVGATPLRQQLPSATGRPPAVTLVEDVGVASPLAVPAPAAASAVSTCSGVLEGCSRVLARDEEPTTPCSTRFALVDYNTSPSTAAGSPPAAVVLVDYGASPLGVSPAEVGTPPSTTCAPLAAALVDYDMTPSVSRFRKGDGSSPSPRLDEAGFALDPDEPAREDGGRVEGKARVTSDPAGSRGEALICGQEEEETADAACLSTREVEGPVDVSNQKPITPEEIGAAGAEPVTAVSEDGVSGLSEESIAVAPEGTLVAAGVAGSAETPDDGEEAQAGEMAAAVASTETEAASNARGKEPYAGLNSPDVTPGGAEEAMAGVAVAAIVPSETSNDAQSEAPLAVAMDLDIGAALEMVVAGVVASMAVSAEEDCSAPAERPLASVMGLDAPGTVEEAITDEVVTSTMPTEPADDEEGGNPLEVAAESDAVAMAVTEELVPEAVEEVHVPSIGQLDVDEATATQPAVLGCEGPPASPGAVAGPNVASPSKGSSSSVEYARQDLSPPPVVQEVRAVRRSARRRSVAFPSAPCFETTLSSVNVVSAGARGDNQGIQPGEETRPPRRPRRRRSVAPEKPRSVEAPAQTPAPALAPVPAPAYPVMDLHIAGALEGAVAGVVARTAAPAEEDCDAQAEELRASVMGLDAPGTVEGAIADGVVTSTVPTETADDAQGRYPLGVPVESDAAETAVPEELVPEVAQEVHAPSTGQLDVNEATATQPAVLGCKGPPASPGAVAGPDAASRSNGSSSSVEHARQDVSPPPVVQEVRAVRRSARRRSVAFPSAPCFETTLNSVRAEARGDDQGIQPIEEARPPRRPRRRRSVAPKKPPLVGAPTPLSSPPPPADATSSEYSSSPIGSGLCDVQFAFPVHEGRPPPRSGRRRSIAPKKILSAAAAAATSTAATTPTAAEAAAVPPFGEATSSAAAKEKSLSSTDARPSDDGQSSLPSDEGLLQPRRPRQRRQPLAATPTEQQQIAAEILPPVDVAETAASSEEQGTQNESLPEQQVGLPRRRSTRRKSIRGSRAGGSLLEENTAAPQVEAPVFLQEGPGGDGSGGAGGSGRALVVEAERGGTEATTDVAVEQGGTVMAGLLNQCLEAARAEVPQGDDVLPLLRDLSDAWIDAEACALKNAAADDDDEMHRRSAVVGAGKAGPPRVVRLCAFNFSAVGMPLDTAAGSELQVLEVVRCLEGVVTALHKIQHFHRRCNFTLKTTGGSGDESNGNGNRLVAWKAFLREVRAAAASANASGEGGGGGGGAMAAPRGGGRDRKGRRRPAGMKEKEMAKAGLVLLGDLEPLERSPEGPVKSPLRDRLASMLSSLIRFHLRIRLDAPPERLTRAPEALPSCGDPSYAEAKRRAEVLPPSHFSKVHTVVGASETDATLGASFSKALFRLKGFSCEMAVEVLSAAEAFAAADQTRLAERDGGVPARVESAGRLLSATADVVDAVRARKFVLSLLEFEGVDEAIVEAGGWGNVEMWASSLKELKGCADIDEPLTLLSDVGAFKAWLRSEPTWGHAAETAESVLRSLLELPALRGLVERARQRWMCPEAYQALRQEILEAAHDRFRIPELKKKEGEAAADGKVETAVVEQSAGKG